MSLWLMQSVLVLLPCSSILPPNFSTSHNPEIAGFDDTADLWLVRRCQTSFNAWIALVHWHLFAIQSFVILDQHDQSLDYRVPNSGDATYCREERRNGGCEQEHFTGPACSRQSRDYLSRLCEPVILFKNFLRSNLH